MNLNERNVFLLDGIGALLSAMIAGLLLPHYTYWIGLPNWILYSLAALGFTYCCYSLSCYKFPTEIKPSMLSVIILANVFYCLITVSIILFFNGLTNWGRAFLIAEMIIILGLAITEMRLYRKISTVAS